MSGAVNIREEYEVARSRWDGIMVSQHDFEARLTACLQRRPVQAVPADLANDLYLVVAVERGDSTAWGRFYEEHFEFIRNVARRFAANDEDAEEIAQQYCSEFPQRVAKFAGRCSLRGWLCAVIPNVVRDYYRRRSKETSRDAIEDRVQEGEAKTTDTDEGQAAREMRDTMDEKRCRKLLKPLVEKALEALKPKERELIHYRHILGLKAKVVAGEIFGIAEDVFSKWNKKAITKLKKRTSRLLDAHLRIGGEEIRHCLDLLGTTGLDVNWLSSS